MSTTTSSSITLYDTTLRDGAQGEGINFSRADKLRLARRLDAFGMHYIEGGWPGSNEKDIEFFRGAGRARRKPPKHGASRTPRRAPPPAPPQHPPPAAIARHRGPRDRPAGEDAAGGGNARGHAGVQGFRPARARNP